MFLLNFGAKLQMDEYEPLEQIGSGSFGIIRKVRRLSDNKVEGRVLLL